MAFTEEEGEGEVGREGPRGRGLMPFSRSLRSRSSLEMVMNFMPGFFLMWRNRHLSTVWPCLPQWEQQGIEASVTWTLVVSGVRVPEVNEANKFGKWENRPMNARMASRSP